MSKVKRYEIVGEDFLPPFKIAGNRTPRQFAAELAEAAQMHAGYGWAWHFNLAAHMLAFFAPSDEEWIKCFGEPGDREATDWNGFSQEQQDLVRFHMWKPLYHLPYKRRVEMKKRSGETSIIDSGDHPRDHWEALGFVGWREVRPEGQEVRLPISGQKPPRPESFAETLEGLKAERRKREEKPPINFNGENVREWGKKPAVTEATARPRIRIPDKPILEAPAPLKRPRLAIPPAAPPKGFRPRLTGRPGLFDEDE